MKRLTLIAAALLIGSAVFAQSPQRAPRQPVLPAPEKITLSGTLALDQGHIVLKSGDDSYLVRGLRPLIGFVDGLAEGASVNLEGYAREFSFRQNPRDGGKSETNVVRSIRVTRLTLGSKSYDLPVYPAGDFGAGRGREQRGRGPAGPGDRRGQGQYHHPCWR
ncbi:MAG: hypothetical protein LBB82_04080 [Treponema sp.]|nr:hypothetical protein [Treponema sp.]